MNVCKKVFEEYVDREIKILQTLAKKYTMSIEEIAKIISYGEYSDMSCVFEEWKDMIVDLVIELQEKYNVIIDHEGESVRIFTEDDDCGY